mgnify:CR=1 FL=1
MSDIAGKTGKKTRFFIAGWEGFTINIANIELVSMAGIAIWPHHCSMLRRNWFVGMNNDIITFKGGRDGLTIYCSQEAGWDEVIASIKARLEGKEGSFFEGASVVFDAGARNLSPEQVSSLWQVLQENGLIVRSIKTSAGKKSAAEKYNEIIKGDGKIFRETDDICKDPTLVVRRNVRSGQDITFAGNIIVFGDVNPGAKITASGFIMVMGSLMGTVHAGAEGNRDAWVGALRLQPTQLRIANFITRAPEEEPVRPEIAQISEGLVVVREIKGIANNIQQDIRRN